MSGTMMNRAGPALVASLVATRRLERFGNDAAPFRNTLLLSTLLCGNPAGQLVTSMRSAQDTESLLDERARLRDQLGTHRLAILEAPAITGTPAVGSALKAKPGRYAGTGNTTVRRRQWELAGGGPLMAGDDYTPDGKAADQDIVLWEILDGPGGPVAVASAPVRVARAPSQTATPAATGASASGTGTGSGGATATVSLPASTLAAPTPPTITGATRLGASLGIDLGAAGTVSADPNGTRTVEWMHDGTSTVRKTGETYVLEKDDVGQKLVAVVKVPLTGGGVASFTTAATAPVTPK